eukprot:TRINITY_DN4102_c0_g1_i1.p1 TRINITY_DN4102_c0_g1~~TRINITY_DN4102_c0_g1_i1.p1  ORF type:complete len:363 (+),score=134.71 TRINITY_DN4102_c0_g1_i1:298-1386(+)
MRRFRTLAAAVGGATVGSHTTDACAGSGPDLAVLATLRSLYHRGFAFPSWVCGSQPTISEWDWGGVEVYYPSGRAEEEVRRVVTEREPVNIAMSRLYDEAGMERRFGWRRSRYTTHWDETGALAPNVAVYCRTPLSLSASNGEGESQARPASEAHIINVVAPAFDSPAQPDMQYFFPGGRDDRISAAKLEEVRAFYRQVFGFVFECARRQGLRKVALSLFGTGAFSGLYAGPNDEGVFESVYLPALGDACRLYSGSLQHIDDIGCFGTAADGESLEAVREVVRSAGKQSSRYGLFPRHTPTDGSTLLVNAWDPHSLCGNGNSADNSLDGYVGRHTSVAVLCWPPVNRQMRYVEVQTPTAAAA